MNKNLFSIVIIITGILFSCTAVDEPLLDNPYDPNFMFPPDLASSIETAIKDGEEINTTEASFKWIAKDGTESGFEYMLDGVDNDFMDWPDSKIASYSFLDEGEYTFLVQRKTTKSGEEKKDTSINFTVNAVTNFALIFEKYNTSAPSGTNFSINLKVENAKAISGFTTIINYENSKLTYESVQALTNIEGIDNIAVFPKLITAGQLELNVLLLGTNGGFIGDANLCALNFKSNSDNPSEISISESSTEIRNASNNNISINNFRQAYVNE